MFKIKSLLAAAGLALSIFSAPASASLFEFNWQWTGSELHGITKRDGIVIQDANVGTEYTSDYGLWAGTVDLGFSGAFNFFDASHNLVFTYAPSGVAGNGFFAVPILNSVNGPLTALPGGTDLLATTSVQDLLTFTANRGVDTYVLQFQDLTAGTVPEPASLVLFGLGFVGLGYCRRKAKQV